MKIIVTVTNYAVALHIGGDLEKFSDIIDIPDRSIPPRLKRYLNDKDHKKWETVSFSILDEKKDEIYNEGDKR